MKQIFKLIVAILFMAVAVNSYAAKNEDVTLIVTSDGATKDEAIKNALRNAIEQTYGVFVSANTDILNDEIVSDEIATVASGNIKSYKELSSSQSDGKITVTLEAVVSIGKLISYAKSKGAECELDGAALGRDIELKLLFKKNEEKAIENLISALKKQLVDCFNYSISTDKLTFTEYETKDWGRRYFTRYYTTYDDNSVSIPIKVTVTLNEKGAEEFNRLFENLGLIGEKMPTKAEMKEIREKAEKEISKIKGHPKPGEVEKVLEKYGLSTFDIYGTSRRNGNRDNNEFAYHYVTPHKDNELEIYFRSEKSVSMLEKFFSDLGDSEMNAFLIDYEIMSGENSFNRYKNISGHHREFLWNDISHGRGTNFYKGDEFYFSVEMFTIPQSELKLIKNISVQHRQNKL